MLHRTKALPTVLGRWRDPARALQGDMSSKKHRTRKTDARKSNAKTKPKRSPPRSTSRRAPVAKPSPSRDIAVGAGQPLCFVLMPFGKKKDARGGAAIDFDRIYEDAIAPAVEGAGMEPVRADAESTGGIIHKAMFERLLLCDYAVADLTTANPNVFYELGVRHAARPRTTVAIFANGKEIPFDVRYLRQLPYRLGDDNKFGSRQAEPLKASLRELLEKTRLVSQRDAATDSPLYQLLQGYKAPDLAHLVTDTFREQARYSEHLRRELAVARAKPNAEALSSLRAFEGKLRGKFDTVVPGVLVDLYLSYRAIEAWDAMIELYDRLPRELQQTVMVREQLALAMNRRKRPGDSEQALQILTSIEKERGPNPETCGLIGRIYKDRWGAAVQANDLVKAAGHLDQALDAYLRGYEADWRDSYPGVNAVTLLELRGEPADLARRDQLAGVVQYALDRKMAGGAVDYWDLATQLELAVIRNDRARAGQCLAQARSAVREPFEPKTTANNLKMIAYVRTKRGEDAGWVRGMVEELERAIR